MKHPPPDDFPQRTVVVTLEDGQQVLLILWEGCNQLHVAHRQERSHVWSPPFGRDDQQLPGTYSVEGSH